MDEWQRRLCRIGKSVTTVSFESNLRTPALWIWCVRQDGDHLNVDGVRTELFCTTRRDPLRGGWRSGDALDTATMLHAKCDGKRRTAHREMQSGWPITTPAPALPTSSPAPPRRPPFSPLRTLASTLTSASHRQPSRTAAQRSPLELPLPRNTMRSSSPSTFGSW